MSRLSITILLLLLISCAKHAKKKEAHHPYTGPLSKLYEATIIYSDSARQKVIIKAKELMDYQNGDREIPAGIFITFYKKDNTISATLKANYAYFYKKEERWKALGNVVINNISNKETLKSEELFWEMRKEYVYTKKFVKIETAGELMTGTGLKAKQDFSEWTLESPEGVISVEDE